MTGCSRTIIVRFTVRRRELFHSTSSTHRNLVASVHQWPELRHSAFSVPRRAHNAPSGTPRNTRAGPPAATQLSGTSRVTIALAPMITLLPTRVAPMILTPREIQTLSPTDGTPDPKLPPSVVFYPIITRRPITLRLCRTTPPP